MTIKNNKSGAVMPLDTPALPLQTVSQDTMIEKYAKNDETTYLQIYDRVARALVVNEPAERRADVLALFNKALRDGFVPAGRVLSAAGVNLKSTLVNCFVQNFSDQLTGDESGVPGIYDALSQAAETLRRGGGVGYDFSPIRPKGALVKGTLSHASGPLSFMEVFDQSCKTIESAGARRGAQMGVLRVDHPDIKEFVTAKNTPNTLTQFNVSVAVTNSFLDALNEGVPFELVHSEPPYDKAGSHQNDDGLWVYETIDPKELWDLIIQQTYDHAEPGVLFVDEANAENNLWYCETFAATNPCAEQWLPPYGCCCLGSINLTKFVRNPFTPEASFDYEAFAETAMVGVHMLDNVLDVTVWPLPQQGVEAFSKRRIGLGFLGLGDALAMLCIPYNSKEGFATAEKISCRMRDAAYLSSIELSKEKGSFELFDAEKYGQSAFVKRLPKEVQQGIQEHGIRNSHLLSIAPTGTISLAMADNASNGIEPAFSWSYVRKKRMQDESFEFYPVVDHAFRLYCQIVHGVDPANVDKEALPELEQNLPEYFVSAQDISASDHMRMVATVQPHVDSSISKTVNVPADYPFEDFKSLYMDAAKAGLKGLATFRPNDITGSVLSIDAPKEATAGLNQLADDDVNRRLTLDALPEPILNSLRWPKRPALPNGNPSWTFMVKTDEYHFAIMIGYTENGSKHPFEIWVNGSRQPRGLGAIAKALSMDLRSNDSSFVRAKLDSLEQAKGDDGFDLEMPPSGTVIRVPSLVSGFAKLVKYCLLMLEDDAPGIPRIGRGATDLLDDPMTPMMDALMSPKEPKTRAAGTMAWSVDLRNHATGDDCLLVVKELEMPNGQRRPYSIWLSGEYPRAFDGLCKVLSFDMRIVDPAWIGAKLRSLVDFAEPMGDFMAQSPGSEKQANYPSTVAYIAKLLMHRYEQLGILDAEGYPIENAGLMDGDYHAHVEIRRTEDKRHANTGRLCDNCNVFAVIRRDGCDFCTDCGQQGSCG